MQYAQKRCHKNPIPDQQIAHCVHRLCPIGGAENRFAGIALQPFASSRNKSPKQRRRLAAQVVYLVYRYSEVACGAMVAPEIVDKLLALSAAFTRAAKMIDYPAQDSAKRESSRCSKCSIFFTVRVARHGKLPIWFWANLPRLMPFPPPDYCLGSSELIPDWVVCYIPQQSLFSGQLCVV